MSISSCCSGIVMLCTVFTTSFYQFVMMAALFSLFASGYMAVNSSILVDILGACNIAQSMGFFIMASGLGDLIAGATSGMLLDYLGDTKMVFLLSGSIHIIGSICLLSCYVCQRVSAKAQEMNGIVI